MKIKDIFIGKKKEERKKVKFIFEVPIELLNDFVNKIWATERFEADFTDKEIEQVGELVKNKEKQEVVFKYE